jgi:hypothetical protein
MERASFFILRIFWRAHKSSLNGQPNTRPCLLGICQGYNMVGRALYFQFPLASRQTREYRILCMLTKSENLPLKSHRRSRTQEMEMRLMGSH